MHNAEKDGEVAFDNIHNEENVDRRIDEEESESIESEADNLNLEETQDDFVVLI